MPSNLILRKLISRQKGFGFSTQPLNTTTALAAYSLRQLKSSNTYAIRVRNSSNIEQDIGFDSYGNLDTRSLLNFANPNAWVTTFYDLSGNGHNVSQSVATDQPQIVSNGTIITQNNKPAILWSDTAKGFLCNSFLSTRNTISSFAVVNPSISTKLILWAEDVVANGWGLIGYNYDTTARLSKFRGEKRSTVTMDILAPAWNNKLFLDTRIITPGTITAYANSNTLIGYNTLASAYGSPADTATFGIGYRNFAGNQEPYKGYLQELILVTSSSSVIKSTLESDMNNYYSIY